MAVEFRKLHLLMLAAKLAEMSLVLRLPWAYHLEINDKTRVSNSLPMVLHFLWLGGQQLCLLGSAV